MLGPIGWGINIFVENYPNEDQGCFCKGYQRMVVWDCAIIGSLLGREFKTCLIGNHLGSTPDAFDMRSFLKKKGCNLIEVGSEPTSPPVDIVIHSMMSTTRTWFSNISPPPVNIISGILQSEFHDSVDIIYSDHWMTWTDASQLFDELQKRNRLIYYNVGDCSDPSPIRTLLNNNDAPCILQISLKGEFQTNDLPTLFSLKSNQTVIITRGEQDVLLVSGSTIRSFNVVPISHVNTTGAGALFSSAVISFLSRDLGNWIERVDEAITYGIESTRDILKNELDRSFMF